MIISVVATKIWYLINVQFLLGHPVHVWHSTVSKAAAYRQALHRSGGKGYEKEFSDWIDLMAGTDWVR